MDFCNRFRHFPGDLARLTRSEPSEFRRHDDGVVGLERERLALPRPINDLLLSGSELRFSIGFHRRCDRKASCKPALRTGGISCGVRNISLEALPPKEERGLTGKIKKAGQ